MMEELRITEVFYSLQGEARTVGIPTVFIRLTGCPLRCGYCDSEYAFHGGVKKSIEELLVEVTSFGSKYVCVTGGEPLAQPAVHKLLSSLCDLDLFVSLETSGALPIEAVDERVNIVMDLKTPDSNEVSKNLYTNIPFLKEKDQVKFVISSLEDYQWARFKLDEYSLCERVGDVLFSPCFDLVKPEDLANWILQDRLPVRFQMQLHKILWGDLPGV